MPPASSFAVSSSWSVVARLFALAAFVASAATAHGGVKGYYRFPTIHGERIVFSSEGDLWSVPLSGGLAHRLTTDEGVEAFPKFSPDGSLVAFSAEYDGNVDVYVVDAEGGAPHRLTYHPGREEVVAWKPDGRAVVFRSRHLGPNDEHFLFEVPVIDGGATSGGDPKLLPVGTGALCDFSADGRHVAFNRWAGETATWKRYRGGTAQEVWVGDLTDARDGRSGQFHRMTQWEGSDRFPMWSDRDGRVYYLSDRGEDGRMNVWSCRPDGSNAQQHTHHVEYDASWSDLDPDSGRIVYVHAGDLRVLDVNTGEDRLVEIEIPSDRLQLRSRFEDPAETLDWYALDDDGSHVALSSRGEMWVSPDKQPGRIVRLTQSSGTRERSPVFSPDGQQVCAITDQTGEQELALWDAKGKGEPRVLTKGGQGWIFPPVWSPDGTKIAYADLTMTLYVVDVESGEAAKIDQAEGWEITDYAFSPDSRWIAYVKPREWDATEIWISAVENPQPVAVTSPWSVDHSPSWDPNGEYLYFISSRFVDPVFDERDFNHIIMKSEMPCALILAKDGLSPFLPDEMYPEEEAEKEEAGEGEDKSTAGESDEDDAGEGDDPEDPDIADEEAADEEDEEPVEVRIDLEDLAARVVEFPIDPDNYVSLTALDGKVLYMSYPVLGMVSGGEADDVTGTLHAFNLEEQEADAFIEGILDYAVSQDGSKIAFRTAGDGPILIAATDAPPVVEEIKEQVAVSELPLLVDPAEEWTQIFNEAWRLQRDFYWAENMVGVDWPLMYDRYCALLPRVGTRQELNNLIGELIGELGTSHTYIWGGDAINADPLDVGLLGADLEPDEAANAHRFVRILRAEAWETDAPSPLTATHADVKEGDYLFAINGRDVGAADSIWRHLAGLAGDQVLLTVGTNPDRSDARDVQIEALDEEGRLRYFDWCRRNREYVEEKSGGRIGYFHLPDMGTDGLVQFIKGFYPQVGKDGLIVDVRYNGGGFVSQMLIERLGREVLAYDRPRRGAGTTYPYRTHAGHKVCLINESAGSDGDIFPASFRKKGLGPLIGTRTWGGVIGIRSDKPFIDGGMSTQPEFAWWEAEDGWTIENHGVDPDIVLDILPEDYVLDRDPQLGRAIEEIETRLREDPVAHPAPPAMPQRWSRPKGAATGQ